MLHIGPLKRNWKGCQWKITALVFWLTMVNFMKRENPTRRSIISVSTLVFLFFFVFFFMCKWKGAGALRDSCIDCTSWSVFSSSHISFSFGTIDIQLKWGGRKGVGGLVDYPRGGKTARARLRHDDQQLRQKYIPSPIPARCPFICPQRWWGLGGPKWSI